MILELNFFLEKNDYFPSEKNGICSDMSVHSISNADECRKAIDEIQNWEPEVTFSGEESSPNWPKGCYISGEKLYWNSHDVGEQHECARQICKPKSKLTKIVFTKG